MRDRMLKLKKNSNGFTLIELLATITIVGILSTIAITAVSKMIASSHKNYYKTLEKNIALAAESYAQNNRNYLPKTENASTTISLKQLVENNYIKNVVDHADHKCNLDASQIKITKKNKKYNYEVELHCPNYKK